MKRKHLTRQPGIGDFKNKCSEMVKRYDARIIRVIYESIHEEVYWNGASSSSTQRDNSREIEVLLRKQKISVIHLDAIVAEMLTYFGRFLILLDSSKRRQN